MDPQRSGTAVYGMLAWGKLIPSALAAAWSPRALPASDPGRQVHAPAHIERADALGSVDLVAADGHEVDLALVHVNRDLTHRL